MDILKLLGDSNVKPNSASLNLDDYVEDGRYVESPSDGKIYRIRAAYQRVKMLGRPLTDEELDEFLIRD